MTVRCKYKLVSKTGDAGSGYTITLAPVTGGSPENDAFFTATPAGEFRLSTVNAAAADQLVKGAEYYIDIIAAP